MRVPRLILTAAGACALALAMAAGSGPAVSGQVRPTAAPPAPASPAALADVVVRPGVRHVGWAQASPPTTAYCEKLYKVACYQPAQIQQAYNLPAVYHQQHITGRGATIVIVDSFGSPTIRHDLAVFDRTFHLPAPPSFQVIHPVGTVPYDPGNSDMVGWAGETTLDVEYAHVTAPGANILLVETPVSETEGVHGFPQIIAAEKYVIRHHLGDVISQSFSATEQTFPSRAAVQALRGAYQLAAANHVTVLAASGDSGAADVGLDQSTYYLYPVTSWPDSDPLVTGVGGTQLHFGPHGRPAAPTVWNDTYDRAANEFADGNAGPNPLASGGGRSALFPRPAYQDGVRNITGNRRGVPDISMSAACNGSVDTYGTYGGQPQPGWSPACGTSEATPLFAGIVALARQAAGHPLGLINPALYRLAAQHQPGIVDVTSGNNTVTFTQGGRRHTVSGYPARPGYDLASGVGTVNGAFFVQELAFLASS